MLGRNKIIYTSILLGITLMTGCSNDKAQEKIEKVGETEVVSVRGESGLVGYSNGISIVKREGLPLLAVENKEGLESIYLRYSFTLENNSTKDYGVVTEDDEPYAGLDYYLEPTKDMVDEVTNTLGVNIFAEEGNELGLGGYTLHGVIDSGESIEGGYIDYYIGTVNGAEYGYVEPKEDDIKHIEDMAKKAKLIVTLGEEELLRINFN